MAFSPLTQKLFGVFAVSAALGAGGCASTGPTNVYDDVYRQDMKAGAQEQVRANLVTVLAEKIVAGDKDPTLLPLLVQIYLNMNEGDQKRYEIDQVVDSLGKTKEFEQQIEIMKHLRACGGGVIRIQVDQHGMARAVCDGSYQEGAAAAPK